MVSFTDLRDGDTRHRISHLSPLAVAPSYQRRGIGSALVRAVAAAAREMGAPCVVLEGAPSFYGRLGFEPSASRGITIDLPWWAPREAAQIIVLAEYDGAKRRRVVAERRQRALPVSTQRRNTSTFASGQGPSHGMVPELRRARMTSA